MLHPPTDNLYKFLAISGLIIVGVSVFYFEKNQTDTEMALIELKASTASVGRMIDIQMSDVEAILRLNETFQKTQRDVVDTASSADFEKAMQMLRLKRDEGLRLANNATAFAQQGSLLEQLEFLHERRSTYQLACCTGIFGGLGLSAFGFSLWYMKVQRPLDRQLMAATPITAPPAEVSAPNHSPSSAASRLPLSGPSVVMKPNVLTS